MDPYVSAEVAELLDRTSGNYDVGLARWFASSSEGEVISASHINEGEEADYVVVCDFRGRQIPMNGRPFVARVERSRPNQSRDWSKSELIGDQCERSSVEPFKMSGHPRLRLPKSVQFHRVGDHLVLDHPKDESTISFVSSVAGYDLPDVYPCVDFSQRATVCWDGRGEFDFIGLVGSRYTVLPNRILASDALEFSKAIASASETVEPNRPPISSYARATIPRAYFGLAMSLDGLRYSDIEAETFSRELILHHSHNGARTYTQLIVLRDRLLESKPIVHLERCRIKHMRNIVRRSDEIRGALDEMHDEVRRFLKLRAELIAHQISLEGKELESFVAKHVPTGSRDRWIIGKFTKRFLAETASDASNRNAWVLYLSVCAVDGEYWDDNLEMDGTPSLVNVSRAYGRREKSFERLIDHVRTGDQGQCSWCAVKQ